MSFRDGLRTIVVATDLNGQAGVPADRSSSVGSETEAALEYARKLATNYGARIVLAHGVDPLDYAAVDAVPDRVRKGLTDEAREVLDRLAGDLFREGIHTHSEVRQGAVAQMLVDVARQYRAELIVIGTKGKEGAGPVVVGAIAEQLVRLAPCAVLAVAADWNAGAYRPTPGGPVLLAMGRNEAAPAAAATAYSLAETFQRPLLMLHARASAEASAFLNPCDPRLEDFGIQPSGQIPVCCLVKDGNPVDAIVEAIAQYHPCILVAGVKRASETPGPHGTAFALLARSRVPVLCVPPEAVRAVAAREDAIAVEVR
jgi:nucleotide-binding universal stress UspA family protein